jgi:hypothetical protein
MRLTEGFEVDGGSVFVSICAGHVLGRARTVRMVRMVRTFGKFNSGVSSDKRPCKQGNSASGERTVNVRPGHQSNFGIPPRPLAGARFQMTYEMLRWHWYCSITLFSFP